MSAAVQQVGGLISGKAGGGLRKVAGLAGRLVGSGVNATSNATQKMLRAGGAGIQHIIPRFK